MTAQGKTKGRHPGLSLPSPHFYDPEGVAQKYDNVFCPAPTGRKNFLG